MYRRLTIWILMLAALLFTACQSNQRAHSNLQPSGALPVIRIDTRGSQPVDSKEQWRSGVIKVEASHLEMDVAIRGRGNTTWERSDKRPYRIKLDEAYPLLDMHESKHFVLLSEVAVPQAMIATAVGFELSRRVAMEFTPQIVPVELVLDGDYRGVYLLTEQVRVEPGRVEVKAWPKRDKWNNRGGWLLEVDGWQSFQRLFVKSRMGVDIQVVHHYPPSLNSWQRAYMADLLSRLDSALCVEDKSSRAWEQLVDMDELAKFYIVNELMDNCEVFSGSCWLSRDAGDTAKFKFGPVWDFGSAFSHRHIDKPECFIYENVPSYCSPLWLKEIVRFPRFQQCVREHYRQLKASGGDELDSFIDDFVQQVAPACVVEAQRWQGSPVVELQVQAEWVKQYLKRKIAFLDSRWL